MRLCRLLTLGMLTLLLTGCGVSRMRLAGPPGLVLLSEVRGSGEIVDQRLMVPGEVESSKVSVWEVRRPERTAPLGVEIFEGGKSVLQRTIPEGAIGFVATKGEERWEVEILRSAPAYRPALDR